MPVTAFVTSGQTQTGAEKTASAKRLFNESGRLSEDCLELPGCPNFSDLVVPGANHSRGKSAALNYYGEKLKFFQTSKYQDWEVLTLNEINRV